MLTGLGYSPGQYQQSEMLELASTFDLHDYFCMLCYIHYMVCLRIDKMSIGSSGRIVIEIDPDLKRQLYSVLVQDGMSLKSWFLNEANLYLSTRQDSEKIVVDASALNVECLK